MEDAEIEVDENEINSDKVNYGYRHHRIVLSYNESGVAKFNRFEDDQPLNSDELLFKVRRAIRRNNTKYFFKIDVSQNSFLIEENTEKKYEEKAKYGVFKVGPDGDYVLVDLADKDLNKLTVIKEQ